ncbi:hypothetical protein LMG26854_03319 [Achromobacter aegrifaciens]|uniref:ADP-ribosyltransferase-containing protein n=1 Tax=Achromobacter aegrifaciens TaxID=1287736 RepID=UPI0014698021|nr:hypothetical protein [Achromobacter aegrifaciens]CAB3858059.1 hypothetical protein LMG26854_03319 [Achromobacter aegrifaciens]
MAAETLDTASAVSAYLNDPNPPTTDPAGATRVSVAAALGSNPDLEAELRQVATRTGIPIDSVRRHPEEVKREAALTSFDFERLARDFPSTAAYLAGVENARIAHDDVDNMGVIEKGLRGLANVGKAAASAIPQAGGALWRVGQGAAENLAPLLDPLAGTLLPENPLRRLAAGMADQGRAGEISAKGLMPQAAGNIEAGVYSGVQSLVTMGLTLPASIVTGNPAPTLYGMSAITGGQAYGQAREAGMDPYRALMFGTSQAAIEYATERIPVGRFLHDMKAGTPLWNMLLRQVSAEIPGEQVATALQDLNEWAVLNPEKPFSDYLAARPDAAAQTLVATIVASGGAVGTAQLANTAADRLAGRTVRAERAQLDGQVLAELDATAAASKLRARSPEDFQAFVKDAMADGPVQDVYIRAEDLAQSGVDIAQLAQVSPAVAAQYEQALATGGDVRIPVDEYATRVAGTDLSQSMLPFLKTDPAGMTQAQAQEFMQNRSEQLRAEVEQVMAEREADAPFKESKDLVEAELMTQLEQAARFTPDVNRAYAGMMSNFYAVQAARLGVTPQEMYQRYPVQIRAEGMGQLNQALAAQPPKGWIHSTSGADAAALWDGQADGTTVFWTDLQGKLGDDLPGTAGYSHSLGRSDLAHIRKAHGDVAAETARGQLPITAADVAQVPDIVTDYDAMRADLRGANGSDRIAYAKRVSDGVLVYLEEVSHKRQNMRGVTMWKYPPSVDEQQILQSATAGQTSETDGGMGNSVGPNGRELNQSEVPQTGTPEFLRWFGDSKAVDAQGRPLVLYHGSETAGFDTFNSDETGIFFTTSRLMASQYAGSRAEARAGENAPSIYHAYVKIENPYEVDWGERDWNKGDGQFRTTDDVARYAKENGYDGAIIRNAKDAATDNYSHVVADIFVPFESNQVKSATENRGTFDAHDPSILNQSERGAYNIDTRTISLLQNADLSTFLHESGHFYLEVLTDIAGQAEAPAAVRDDVQKLMAWFGVQDLAAWNALDLEEKRPFHEQLARGFEAYLFEGKAPAPELQGLFQRFRAWMLAVYRSMSALNVELSDEVRGVFDRMLASTEQIRETETMLDYKPAFTSAEQAGMTPEEWAQYQALGLEATQDAVQQLEARSIRDMKWLSGARSRVIAQLQREAADRRKTVRKEVEAEVMAEPVNQAKTFMKRGVDPVTGEPVSGPTKLQISALEDLYGAEGDRYAMLDWSKLGYGKYGMLAEDGLNPDIVADRFGYESGDGLVRAVLAAEDPRAKIEALTDQRMLERYGDLTDAQSIARAADEAVHNEARGRFIATEVNALQRALGQRQVLARAARQFAEATIARLRIRDVRPSQWVVAEARAARAAETALRKNDLQGAAVEKKRQLVNNYAARAAQAAQAEIEKDLNYMKRLSGSTSQSGMRGESLAQLNALLARFDLRSSMSLRQIDAAKTQSLAEFIASESERLDAVMPDLPAYILDEGFRRHYKDMSVEEFRGLVDSVRQLANLARREQKMYTALRDMSFDEERGAILARLREFNPKAFDEAGDPLAREPEFVPNIRKSVAKLGDGFSGEFLSAETILDILEGGKFGQVHESLFGRMSSRANWKATRMEKVYRDLKPLFKQWNLKERRDYGRKGIVVPSIGTSITRENALVAALLYGNADGRKRLENYGWNDNRMQGVLDVLDERDWNLANAIWEQFDTKLWPELEALNKRTRGKAPPKVEPLPFPTKYGEARGGYFRLKYDTDLDERAHRFDEGAAVRELLGGGMGMSAKTNQGTSTQRKDGVVMRPRLDLGVFVEAVNETVHDLALREAVADTMRLLNDKGIQTAIKSSVGVPAYRALVNRVREVAAPPRNPSGFIEKILASARRNTIVVLMSGVKTALQNVVGLVPALTRVNAGSIGLEMARFYSPAMAERYRFAMENSEYMRHRYQNFDRDLNDMAAKLTVKGRLLPDTATMLALMGLVDRGVSVPLWNAAFKDGMVQFDNDNAKAADYADHIVRQTQGSGRDVDLPKIMSGHGGYGQLKRLFTMFYSYFNSQLQMLVRAGAIAKREAASNPGAAIAKFTVQFVMIAVLPAILTEMMMGNGGDDEDEDKLAKRYARALLMYGAGMFPIVRDISSYTWSVFDTDTYNFGYKISPVQSAGEGVVKGIQSLADIVAGEGDIVDTKNAIMGTSFAFGLPGKLISDFVAGANAWMSGDAGPEALLFGAPRR